MKSKLRSHRTAPTERRSRPRLSRRPSKKVKARTVDADEKAISPSQIATFRECERKWAFDKIDKLPRKPNKYAQLGTLTHKELERWLDFGKPPRAKTLAGRIALAGLHNLPKPRIAKTEKYVRFRYKGVLYHGYVDAFWEHVERPMVFLHDHKTTGDFKWAKTAADLLVDPQMAIYSFGLLLANPRYEEVVGRWQYHLRRATKTKAGYKHRTRLVELYQTREEIEKHMEDVHETGLRIVQARKEPASARPKNFTHCSAYGGCDYAEICHRGVSVRDKFRGIVAHKKRSEAIEILKKRAKKNKSLPVVDVDAVREAKKPKVTKKLKAMQPPPDAKKKKSKKTKDKVKWKATTVRTAYREDSGDTLLKVKFTDGSSHVVRLEGVSPADLVRG